MIRHAVFRPSYKAGSRRFLLRGSRYCSICQTTTDIRQKRKSSRERCTKDATEAEEKRRVDEIQIQTAKIEVDKELALKETDSTSNPPPPRDAKSSKFVSFRG